MFLENQHQKISPEACLSMESLEDFINGHINGSKNPRSTKLETLGHFLVTSKNDEKDPVKYLWNLYFIEKLSVQEIWIKTKQTGMSYTSSDGLHKLFIDLAWKLRENTGYQKFKGPNINGLQANNNHNIGLTEKSQEIFRTEILKILSKKDVITTSPKFNKDEYIGIRYAIDKIWYLLACYSKITPHIIQEISQTTELGARSLSKIINQELEKIKSNGNLKGEIPVCSDTSLGNWIRRQNSSL